MNFGTLQTISVGMPRFEKFFLDFPMMTYLCLQRARFWYLVVVTFTVPTSQ